MRIDGLDADWLVQKVKCCLTSRHRFRTEKRTIDITVARKQLAVCESNDASILSKFSRCRPGNEAVLFSLHNVLQGSSHRGVAWLGTDVLFLARLSRASKTIGDSIRDGTIDSIDGWQVVTENSNELGLIRLFREFFERNPPFCKGCRLTGQCGPNLWLGGCR